MPPYCTLSPPISISLLSLVEWEAVEPPLSSHERSIMDGTPRLSEDSGPGCSAVQHPVCQNRPPIKNSVLRAPGKSACIHNLPQRGSCIPRSLLFPTSGDPLTYSPTLYWSSGRCKRLLRSSFIFYHSRENVKPGGKKHRRVTRNGLWGDGGCRDAMTSACQVTVLPRLAKYGVEIEKVSVTW